MRQGNGKLYNRLMGKVKRAVKGQNIATITFAWLQGEGDARGSHGKVYGESFVGLIHQLRKDLGKNDIHFVIGRLSDINKHRWQ